MLSFAGITVSVSELFFLLIVSFGVYYVVSAVYNVWFHPLSRYPGPFLAKLSGLPSFYHTYRGNRHVWLWQLHQKYGDVVRASYDTLIFSDPHTYREIYGTHANVQKAWHFGVWPKDRTAVSTFAVQDKYEHRRRRRNLDYAFSDRAVRSSELYVIEHVDRWGAILAEGSKDGWSDPRDMTAESDHYVFDILCDLCFGWTYETKKPGPNKLKTVPHDVAQYMKFTYQIFYSPFISIWLFMKPRGLDKLFASMAPPQVQLFMDFVAQSLSKRLEMEKANEKNADYVPEREDMLYYLINAKDADTGKPAYDEINLTEEANMLTAAGADTTSAVMAALFFYLVNDEEALEKLTAEIRTTFAKLDDVKSGKLLTSCTYLHAAVEEALRMNPHGGSESRRQVRPGGIRIKDDVIPAGTIIGGDVFAIQHDENIFAEPFRFKPERWIVGDGVTMEQVKAREQAIFAFSYGQRGCPGKSLAKMELAVTMARLVWAYNFRGMPGGTEGQGGPEMMWGRQDKTQFQVWDFMVAHRHGPMVQFKKRPV